MSIKKRNSLSSKKKYHMRGGFPSFKKPPQTTSYNTVSLIPGTASQETAQQLQQTSTSLPYNTVSSVPVATPVSQEIVPQTSENESNNKSDPVKKPGLFTFIINLATILYTTLKSGQEYIINIINKTNELLITIDLSKIMDTDLRVFLRNKLTELSELSDDPVVQQNLNELAVKLGMYGNVAIGVAFSNVEQYENELINIGIRGTDKITTSLINIMLNAASAIPFLGTAIGAARTFDNAAKMIETIILTNLEIIKKSSDFNEKFINSFTEKIKSMDNLNSGKNILMNNFNQQEDNLTKKLQKNNIINMKGGAVSAIKRANEIKKRVNKSIARFHRISKKKTRRHE